MIKRRSKFEETFELSLKQKGIKYEYEPQKFEYTVIKTYTPDFKIGNMYIETKGYHKGIAEWMQNLKWIRKSHPKMDLRIIFDHSIPKKKIRKGAKMNFGQWADKQNILWAEMKLPQSWIEAGTRKKGSSFEPQCGCKSCPATKKRTS